jgi:hypothetical protein
MKYKNFLFAVIAIEIIFIVYVTSANKDAFIKISGNFYNKKVETTLQPVMSPFTQSILYYIDTIKENVTPIYSCDFLISKEEMRVMLRPDYSQPFDGCTYRLPYVTNVTINSDGFRDRDFLIKKEPDTVRIVAVGDSLTFGWGVELNESWPKILENILNSNTNSKKFEILNLGLPTSNMEDKVDFFLLKGLKYNPDIVIFEYNGYQDSFNYTRVRELNRKYKSNITLLSQLIPDYKKLSEDVLEIELNKKLLDIELKNSRYGNFMATFENSIKKPLLKVRNSTNATMVVAIFIGDLSDESSLHEMEEYGVYLINVRKYISHFNQSELVLRSIDFHPTPKAYVLIAEFIYEKFDGLLALA